MGVTTTQKQLLSIGLVMDKLGVDALEITEKDAAVYHGGVEVYFDRDYYKWVIRRTY